MNLHQPTLRVLKILELLATSQEKLTLSAIAKNLKIPTGTIYPILQTLQEKQYIKCDLKNKTYSLDFQILALANHIKSENKVLELIKKHMKNIRNLTKQTCQMGILKEGNVLYLEKIDADNQVQLKSFIGTSYPAYATSLGKALLVDKSKNELKKTLPTSFSKNHRKNTQQYRRITSRIKNHQKK